MTKLSEKSTLKDMQEYFVAIRKERNWLNQEPLELFLLLSEEIGEVAKAVRNKVGLYPDKSKSPEEMQEDLALEMADVLSYLLDLTNCFDIDLQEAIIKKEAINQHRSWD